MILSTHGIVGSQIVQLTTLLDLYPNAAAAYSLRKLRSAYTGSAIRVRRANDNTEENIGFDSNGNLDTATLTSFCSGTNGFVKTWYDQSGNGNDATQTTAENQPQIVSSGSVLINSGKPIITPISFNNYLSVPLAFNVNYRSFYVLRSSTTFQILFGDNTANSATLVSHSAGGSGIYYNATLNTLRRNGTSFSPSSRLDVYSNTANRCLIYDNVDYNFTNPNNGIFGYSNGLSGVSMYSFQEVVIYPSAQSEISNIETNINNFYSIY